MRILLVSSLKRRLGSELTASRTRIIYQLAQGLLSKGHQVSILGTADSVVPGATIIPVIKTSFVDLPPTENPFYTETGYLVQLALAIKEHAGNFDVIHNHTYPEFINLLVADQIVTPMVTTVHAQATPEFDTTLSTFPEANLVSISQAHKKLFKKAAMNWVVYNGIDTELYAYQEKKEDYLLWIGRLSKAKDAEGNFLDPKGVKWAIQLAQATGEKLQIVGNVEDIEFYNREIKPHLNEKITWYGPIEQEQALKREEIITLMQGAKAFLMTINWEEPFGLVMAEAMSCGTPVIAFNRGSVPEVIKDGVSGFIVPPQQGLDGLVQAVKHLSQLQTRNCREHVIQNFSLNTMVSSYENVYQGLLSKKVLE